MACTSERWQAHSWRGSLRCKPCCRQTDKPCHRHLSHNKGRLYPLADHAPPSSHFQWPVWTHFWTLHAALESNTAYDCHLTLPGPGGFTSMSPWLGALPRSCCGLSLQTTFIDSCYCVCNAPPFSASGSTSAFSLHREQNKKPSAYYDNMLPNWAGMCVGAE